MAGDGAVSAALRAVREGRGSEDSSGDEEAEPGDFTTESEPGAAEEYWSETSSSVEYWSETSSSADSASLSSGQFSEEPRLMYHEVVETDEDLDDGAALLT